MLELLQWILLIFLGIGIGWLLWRRREERLPEWIHEFSREEFVTRSELDRYHHRVIQLCQTNRDLIHTRFEEISQRLGASGSCREDVSSRSVEQHHTEEVPFETIPQKEIADALFMGTASSEIPSPEAKTPPPEPVPPQECAIEEVPLPEDNPSPTGDPVVRGDVGSNPASDVIRSWQEGMSVDQIARELRMGRQEVQLLIQMSRRSPASRIGV